MSSIDWKLFRTLVLAGVVLIVVHEILSHGDDAKRGFMDGFNRESWADRKVANLLGIRGLSQST